jgi:hypothetical protein
MSVDIAKKVDVAHLKRRVVSKPSAKGKGW